MIKFNSFYQGWATDQPYERDAVVNLDSETEAYLIENGYAVEEKPKKATKKTEK